MSQAASARPFIVFGSPEIGDDEVEAVTQVMRSGWLGTGPRVAEFEKAFAQFKQVESSVCVASCTAALHLSMVACGIKPGDEVITTSLTFAATVNAIIHAGGTPVLADVDAQTININPAHIRTLITERTKAILIVHFAGQACDMDEILAIAKEHNLRVIEDCAHAVEGTYKGKPLGTLGDFGCFSFYVTKNMTSVEGGAVIAKSPADLARIKTLALHGMSSDAWRRFGDKGYKHYDVVECGYKYNLTDMQAAIALCQLKKVDRWWEIRKALWNRYSEAFADLPISVPVWVNQAHKHSLHLFTIRIDPKRTGIERDRFLEAMNERKIGTGVHYRAIPEHSYYRTTFGWNPSDYPVATKVGRETVSLPFSAKLSEEEISYILHNVREVITSRA